MPSTLNIGVSGGIGLQSGRLAMRRCTQAAQARSPAQVVAIGMFDGLHIGHRQVLQRLRALGDRLGLPTLVLTFDPHPRSVVGRQPPPRLLCTVDERLDLLAASGLVDAALVLPFDVARSQEPVERFVADTLVGMLGARALVVGANFACGHQRPLNGQLAHPREIVGPVRELAGNCIAQLNQGRHIEQRCCGRCVVLEPGMQFQLGPCDHRRDRPKRVVQIQRNRPDAVDQSQPLRRK